MQPSTKVQDKIKKLLELSLSDNDNEASIALKQAMSLMNKHNLTKDEVYGQKMLSRTIETPYTKVPAWYSVLYARMCDLSGCFAVYRNGQSYLETKAKMVISGRQRDVENAVYLIVFLARELEKSVERYKKSLPRHGRTSITTLVKSYRMGFIVNIFERMEASREQFFSDQNTTNQVICIDHETRIEDARAFYLAENNVRLKKSNSQAWYDRSGISAGKSSAEKLQINNAVNRQDHIYGIGHG